MDGNRKMSWNDVKTIVQLKTFYIVVLLFLLGVICLCISALVGALSAELKNLLSSLGVTFITSSIVSIIMEIFLRLDMADLMGKRILSVMPKELRENVGVREFKNDRKNVDFAEIWEKSESFLKIIGVSANDILSPSNLPRMKSRIKKDRNFRIEILVLCPWSLTAEIRSEASIYRTSNECKLQTHAVMMDIENLVESLKADGVDASNVDIRLYDFIPSLSMIIDGDTVLAAPFMAVAYGGSSPYFIADNIQTESCLYNIYLEHFNAIWKTAPSLHAEGGLEERYREQREKDHSRISQIPENYEAWLVKANKVVRSKA